MKFEDDPQVDGGFRDRRDAGRRVAARLQDYRACPGTVVLGLPRGGVVVAAEIARELLLPLDVLISRKIGAPGNPELAIGAVAEGGQAWIDAEAVEATGATSRYVAAETERQREEIVRRQKVFRSGRPLSLLVDGTVILVDDGIATGSTVIAAIHALREQGVAHIVLAAPVAPPETVEVLRPIVDALVVLSTPAWFRAVGAFYEDFAQTSDDEVRELLAEAAERGTVTPLS